MREEVQMMHLSGNGGTDSETIRHPMPSSENAKLHQDFGKIRHRASKNRKHHHVSKGNHLGSTGGPITEFEDSGLHEKSDDDSNGIFINTEESVKSEDLDPTQGQVTSQGLFIPDEAEEPETLEIPADSKLGNDATSKPMAAHLDTSDLFTNPKESVESEDLDTTEGRVTSQGLIIPDEAEEPETLEIPAESDLGHEHVMNQTMKDLGLQPTQMPEEA